MAQATLSQGNTDFSSWVALDGVEQGYTERAVASVVTLDGVLHKSSIKKRTLAVKLRDMLDTDLASLFASTNQLDLWTYLDANTGETRTVYFYLTGPVVRQTIARQGKTICTGISFVLEER